MERFAACLGIEPETDPKPLAERDVMRSGKVTLRAYSSALPPSSTNLPTSGNRAMYVSQHLGTEEARLVDVSFDS